MRNKLSFKLVSLVVLWAFFLLDIFSITGGMPLINKED